MDLRILVVDDCEENLALMERTLLRVGDCEVWGLQNPLEGLAQCCSRAPDLVFVDYRMPRMDGLEFLRRFRRLPDCADVPIVMVTADEDVAVRDEALARGATDFLTKPVRPVELVARAKNLLRLRESARLVADRAALLQAEVDKATAEIRRREQELLFSLARAAEFRDPETGAHIQRMSHYSRLIAAALGFSAEVQDTLLKAAPMHDIGKLGIPDHILLKPAKLTAEEFEIMKRHPRHGHDILLRSDSPVVRAGATIALSHHEKWDGSGYPHRLRGAAIPMLGRIVAVADVFDALTSERPYKKAWPLAEAATYLREQSGRHFDPDCVAAFFARWDDALQVRAAHQDPEPAGILAAA